MRAGSAEQCTGEKQAGNGPLENRPCILPAIGRLWTSINNGGTSMAKGQVRSNKEVRKPKKHKAAAKSAPPLLGAQVKNSESSLKKK